MTVWRLRLAGSIEMAAIESIMAELAESRTQLCNDDQRRGI